MAQQRYPSVKALMRIKDVTAEDARAIRAIMAGPRLTVPCRTCGEVFTARRGYFRIEVDSPADHAHYPSTRDEDVQTRLQRIDKILRTCGVEYIAAGPRQRSPAFYYCNTGDTYAVTVLKVRGRFRVGTWGDIVERGRYA